MFVIVFVINNLSKHGTFCCSIKIFETHIFGTFLWCLFSPYIRTKVGISDVSLLGAVCDKRRCSLCSSRNLQGRLYDEPKEHLHWHSRFGQHQELQPLEGSDTGSLRFTDFLSLCTCSESSLTNLIGWEYKMDSLCMFRKSDPARGRDSWCWPKGAWPVGMSILHGRLYEW